MGDTFKEKIGQMFIIRLQGKEITNELISLIKKNVKEKDHIELILEQEIINWE